MGSGKTAVAFLALLAAAGSGHQGALMAPTEVLATQHGKTLTALLASLPAQLPDGRRRPTCALITGGVRGLLKHHRRALTQHTSCLSHYRRLLNTATSAEHTSDVDRHPNKSCASAQTRAKERRDILAALEAGELDILVGTHAVISADVRFRSLALAVVDEQHKCARPAALPLLPW